jgi:hypothetical protein
LTGSLAISSDEAVTGPQQSWQPTMQVNDGMRLRNASIFRSLWVTTHRFFAEYFCQQKLSPFLTLVMCAN